MNRLLLLFLFALLAPFAAGAQCVASFSAIATPNNNNLLQWQFQNNSSASVNYTMMLDFGDGNGIQPVYPSQILQHTYAATGSYTAIVTVTSTDSTTGAILCTDADTQTIAVAYTPCETIVTPTLTSVPGSLPATYSFDAVTPYGFSALSYTWNFGDGSSSNTLNPTHTFFNPGVYAVSLTTADGAGTCTYTNYISLTITNGTAGCSGNLPDYTSVINANQVAFTNASAPPTSGFSASYSWNFGDGYSSNAYSPSHTYYATGYYTVWLTSTWLDSATGVVLCADSVQHSITVDSLLPQPGGISGQIIWDSITYSGAIFKVYLIQHNVAANTLTAVDSTYTSGGISSQYYSFSNVPLPQTYLVKAQWSNSGGAAYGPVPTYGASSLYWSGATDVALANPGYYATNTNIFMQEGTPTTGPGFIGGNISLGANKGSGGGVAGCLVFLRDAANTASQYSYTDANGDFQFSNVPTGSYSVYPEKANYATTDFAAISVTGSAPSVTAINFNQDDNQMNIKPRMLGVSYLAAAMENFSIAPVPAGNVLMVTFQTASVAAGFLCIQDPAGRVIQQQAIPAGATAATVNTARLAAGIYFLRVACGNAEAIRRFIIVR